MADIADYITTREVARILKIHRDSVSRLVSRGKLPVARVIGRNNLFLREDVLAYRSRTKRRGRSPS